MTNIIIKNKTPFPHIIIENYYSDVELFHVWKEIEFLSYSNKFKLPEETSTARTIDSKILKNNLGIHLDNLYAEREISNILKLNKKIFNQPLFNEIINFDFSFNNFKVCNIYYTLLSYYENSSYYRPHFDLANYTTLTWLFKEPKKFTGGNLFFPEYDYEIKIKNNMLLIFTSSVMHQVTDVQMKEYDLDEFGMFNGEGRYCLTQFCMPVYSCM